MTSVKTIAKFLLTKLRIDSPIISHFCSGNLIILTIFRITFPKVFQFKIFPLQFCVYIVYYITLILENSDILLIYDYRLAIKSVSVSEMEKGGKRWDNAKWNVNNLSSSLRAWLSLNVHWFSVFFVNSQRQN